VRTLRRILATLLVLFLIALNVGVHRAPAIASEQERTELLSQMGFLEAQMHAGLGDRMQRLFPEGYLFSHLLYGLSWCGIANTSSDTAQRDHALCEARWAYAAISTPSARSLFDGSMVPAHGVFYNGWRNFLLARIVVVSGRDQISTARLGPSRTTGCMVDSALLTEFDSLSTVLAEAFATSASPYLASYPRQAWPADNTVAMASLSLHQRSRGVDHLPVITRWARQVKASSDAVGLIPHAWDMEGATPREGARGSSQSLMNCFLPLIDSTLAQEQFERYREHFLDSRLGVPMVREYPKGTSGRGDVDSGPVVLGVGFSATIVGPGACRMNSNACAATELDGTLEGFGLPIGDRKHYIFGALPIADLFIVWTRTMRAEPCAKSASFLAFHLWSIVVAVLLWAPALIAFWKRRRS
jgi:hypothetical protein